nr:fumarylacetoacetate hydrolase family protein [Dactylosporangium thailandense]
MRTAYAVQSVNVARRLEARRHIVGRKIGLTSPAVQAQLGVDQPDFGVILDDMWCASDRPVDLARLLQPKAEAEIAFVLSEDVLDPAVGSDSIRSSIDNAAAALEIVDSRIERWDITITDTIADNASSGLFVLGRTALPLSGLEPREVVMSMALNGSVVSTGDGSQCLGDPLAALAWLAGTALDLGAPLRAGDIVLSGAMGPMVSVQPGDHVLVELSGLGQLRVDLVRRATCAWLRSALGITDDDWRPVLDAHASAPESGVRIVTA